MRSFFTVPMLALAMLARPAAAQEIPPPSPELVQAPPPARAEPSMHPPIDLFDEHTPGGAVRTAGCGGTERCHDVAWIQSHDFHAMLGSGDVGMRGRAPSGRPWDFGPGLFGRWDPITYDLLPAPGDARSADTLSDWLRSNGWRLVGGGPFADERAGGMKEDCLLCHARGVSNGPRVAEVEAGRSQRAAAATLTSAVLTAGPAAISIHRPKSRACGFCHGVVYEDDAPLSLGPRSPRQRMTETVGTVFSPQRIRDSAMNIAGKDALARPWDVHAERLLSCSSCHFSPNHPAYSNAGTADLPAHLTFDARRIEIDEYLRRPDHNLATGSRQRRCEACHDAPKAHGWLPRADRHFAALACESCHVTTAYAPARQETDFTMLARPGEARVAYRGVAGNVDDPVARIDGFRPLLLPRTQPDGTKKLSPYNLVTTWFWIEDAEGGPRPVARATLTKAFFVGKEHHPDVVRALDRDANGTLDETELVLDTEPKAAAARARLVAAGANNPRMAGEIQPYAIHHGVGPAAYATRSCTTCHARRSRLTDPFVVATRAPFGVVPTVVGDADAVLPGPLEHDADGRLVVRASAKALGLHVFGLSRSGAMDLFGALLVIGALVGAIGHGMLRLRAARRKGQAAS